VLEALVVILFLLPGFVGIAVYDGVAATPRRAPFDKLVFALALTLVANVVTAALREQGLVGSIVVPEAKVFTNPMLSLFGGTTKPETFEAEFQEALLAAVEGGLLPATIIAAASGLAAAWLHNLGWLPRVGLLPPRLASDPWSDVLAHDASVRARILFKDGTVLVGRPLPSANQGAREVFVAHAVWFRPNGRVDRHGRATYRAVEVQGPGVLLTDFAAVQLVEMVRAPGAAPPRVTSSVASAAKALVSRARAPRPGSR
jgi:hypothetical protein